LAVLGSGLRILALSERFAQNRLWSTFGIAGRRKLDYRAFCFIVYFFAQKRTELSLL